MTKQRHDKVTEIIRPADGCRTLDSDQVVLLQHLIVHRLHLVTVDTADAAV